MLEKHDHSVRKMIWMQLVDQSHLASYQVHIDGWDGCRICFAACEYAVEVSGMCLDGCTMQIKEIMLLDDTNSSKRARFHHSNSYKIAELYDLGQTGITSHHMTVSGGGNDLTIIMESLHSN